MEDKCQEKKNHEEGRKLGGNFGLPIREGEMVKLNPSNLELQRKLNYKSL